MAKTKNAPGTGHNSGDENAAKEKAAILTVRIAAIRAAQAEAEKADAVLKAARKKVSDAFKKTTMDVSPTYTRQFVTREILEPLDRVRLGGAEDYEAERRFARATFRFPEDQAQGELVLEDTAAEQARWREAGFRAGQQGLEMDAPDTCPDILVAEYEHAWADGQRALGEALIIEQQAKAAAKAPALADPEPETDGLGDDEIDDAARKLKRSPFMERRAEAEAEAA